MKRTIFFWGILITHAITICDSELEVSLPHIGNFRYKRQPNTNFSFGQNILEKNQYLAYINIAQQKGHQENIFYLVPQLLYGITNAFSVIATLPILPVNNLNYCHARGIGNLTAQLEYAFYQKQTASGVNLATVVANIALPTAHTWSSCVIDKKPLSGFNATSFFIGATASTTSVYWYGYVSPGVILTTKGKSTKLGNQFLYQAGGGRHLTDFGNAIATLLFDINGNYSQKDTINGCSNNNTGSNIIFMGPSLSITGNQWEVKGGIQFPVLQHLNGNLNKQQFQTLISTTLLF